MCLLPAKRAILRATTAVGVACRIRRIGLVAVAPRAALGASSVDDQLLSEHLCASRRLDPRQRLLGQAGHLAALEAEKMDVVVAALAGGCAMAPEAPHAVDALNAVEESGSLESCERPVEGDSVERAGHPLGADLLVRQGPIRISQQLQHDLACLGSSQPRCVQELSAVHLPVVPPIESIQKIKDFQGDAT
jgi:hypothetical protein